MPEQIMVNLSSIILVGAGIGIGFIWGKSSGRSKAFRECLRLFDID